MLSLCVSDLTTALVGVQLRKNPTLFPLPTEGARLSHSTLSLCLHSLVESRLNLWSIVNVVSSNQSWIDT